MSKRVYPKKNVDDLLKDNKVGTRDYYCRLAKVQILRLQQNQAIWMIDRQVEMGLPFSQIMQSCLRQAGAPLHGDAERSRKIAMRYFKKNGPAEGEIEERTGTVRFYFRITMAQYDWLLKMRNAGWTLQRLLIRELNSKGLPPPDEGNEDLRTVRSSDLRAAQEYRKKTHVPEKQGPTVLIGQDPRQAANQARRER